jgi:hypothetical protein
VYYEQARTKDHNNVSNGIFTLASPSVDLAFDDAVLDNVEDAWRTVMAPDEHYQAEEGNRYMVFEDREPVNINDDE